MTMSIPEGRRRPQANHKFVTTTTTATILGEGAAGWDRNMNSCHKFLLESDDDETCAVNPRTHNF